MEQKMALLQEIQADSIDVKIDISVVLRKCKVLSAAEGRIDKAVVARFFRKYARTTK